MRNFGAFLSNLRSSAGLSLEELGLLVDSNKSTLSRLENDDIPQPFKGPTRKLVIALAEILCTSKKETKRYLELAGIDQSLLTEAEEIQLGFVQAIPVHYAEALEGKLVVGHQYGESLNATLRSYSLYSLASSNARWLMQLADVERFAVD